MASTVYCEQVGVYRQEGGNKGEIATWYNLMIAKNIELKINLIPFHIIIYNCIVLSTY